MVCPGHFADVGERPMFGVGADAIKELRDLPMRFAECGQQFGTRPVISMQRVSHRTDKRIVHQRVRRPRTAKRVEHAASHAIRVGKSEVGEDETSLIEMIAATGKHVVGAIPEILHASLLPAHPVLTEKFRFRLVVRQVAARHIFDDHAGIDLRHLRRLNVVFIGIADHPRPWLILDGLGLNVVVEIRIAVREWSHGLHVGIMFGNVPAIVPDEPTKRPFAMVRALLLPETVKKFASKTALPVRMLSETRIRRIPRTAFRTGTKSGTVVLAAAHPWLKAAHLPCLLPPFVPICSLLFPDARLGTAHRNKRLEVQRTPRAIRQKIEIFRMLLPEALPPIAERMAGDGVQPPSEAVANEELCLRRKESVVCLTIGEPDQLSAGRSPKIALIQRLDAATLKAVDSERRPFRYHLSRFTGPNPHDLQFRFKKIIDGI